jgi:uncharacterized protein (DUF2249 family)
LLRANLHGNRRTLPYNPAEQHPLILEVLQELRDKKETPNTADRLILSFFHNLKEFVDNKVQVTDPDYLDLMLILRENKKEYDSFENYSFVKKVNIPHGFQITSVYLKSLFFENCL